MAGNLNDILIAQFKKGFDLTDTQTALVQSIFFLGYFFVALPAAALIKRFSYKAAIIIGLCLYALGCFLFVPAAQIMTYGAFLACLGVIACGLSLRLDPARVNVNGGAIALGHPVGASGAILPVKLMYEMARSGARTGLVTMCIGGGQGISMLFEREGA
ncbi:TPA: hypothetical protein ACN14L_004101 [Klebsiella pneumoniae]